ncbi:hypothetical protein AB0B13_16935 [Streptomyces sp. NPDC042898]|uniref:hypothetical protein n=1 Tax=Streptomyces sp. NPDC042898 TaxID=3154334 RepID=UPI003407B0AC
MDFLLLTPDLSRIVIEVDGVQHYADATGKASPRLYSEMVAEDRRLRLMGYDIYRFGGHELARDEQDRRLPVVLVSSGVLSRPRLTPRPVSLTKPPLVDALPSPSGNATGCMPGIAEKTARMRRHCARGEGVLVSRVTAGE